VLFALVLAISMLLTALVLDAGFAFARRGAAQNAADSAALAAAGVMTEGGSTNQAIAEATSYLQLHGYAEPEAVITVNIPPQDGPHAGDSSYVEVILESSDKALLAQIAGHSLWNIKVRAVAQAGYTPEPDPTPTPEPTPSPPPGETPTPTPPPSPGGYYALFSHGNQTCNGEITMSGGGNNVYGYVHVNGELKTSGSSSSKTSSIIGGASYTCKLSTDNNTIIDPAAVQTSPMDWPIFYYPEDFPCTFGSLDGPTITLTDSQYADLAADPTGKTLKTGVYCSASEVKGTMNGYTGTVTFVAAGTNGNVTLSGGGSNFTAYWNNILAYSWSGSNNNAIVFSGGGHKFTGILLAPRGGVTLSGGNNQGVCGTADLHGAVMAFGKVTMSGGGFSICGAYVPAPGGGGGGEPGGGGETPAPTATPVPVPPPTPVPIRLVE
jgi:hypothetical protein